MSTDSIPPAPPAPTATKPAGKPAVKPTAASVAVDLETVRTSLEKLKRDLPTTICDTAARAATAAVRTAFADRDIVAAEREEESAERADSARIAAEEKARKQKILYAVLAAVAVVLSALMGFLVWHTLSDIRSQIVEVKKAAESQPVPAATVEEKTETTEQPAPEQPPAEPTDPTPASKLSASPPGKPSGEQASGVPDTALSKPAGTDIVNLVSGIKKVLDELSESLQPSTTVVIKTNGQPVSIKELDIGEEAVAREVAETKQETAEERATDAQRSLQELKAELDSAEAEVRQLGTEVGRLERDSSIAEAEAKRLGEQARVDSIRPFVIDALRQIDAKIDELSQLTVAKSAALDEATEALEKLRDELRLRNAPTSQGQQPANP